MNDLFSVKDKVVAITGAGGVLCGCIARALGKAGAKVAVLDIDEAAAEKVAADINKNGNALAINCNVLKKVSIEAACKTITSEFGAVDVLINGAGGNNKKATTGPDLSFFDMPADAVR